MTDDIVETGNSEANEHAAQNNALRQQLSEIQASPYAQEGRASGPVLEHHHRQKYAGQEKDGKRIFSCAVTSAINALDALNVDHHETEDSFIQGIGGVDAFEDNGYLSTEKAYDRLRREYHLIAAPNIQLQNLFTTLEGNGVGLLTYGNHANLISGYEVTDGKINLKINDPLKDIVETKPLEAVVQDIINANQGYQLALVSKTNETVTRDMGTNEGAGASGAEDSLSSPDDLAESTADILTERVVDLAKEGKLGEALRLLTPGMTGEQASALEVTMEVVGENSTLTDNDKEHIVALLNATKVPSDQVKGLLEGTNLDGETKAEILGKLTTAASETPDDEEAQRQQAANLKALTEATKSMLTEQRKALSEDTELTPEARQRSLDRLQKIEARIEKWVGRANNWLHPEDPLKTWSARGGKTLASIAIGVILFAIWELSVLGKIKIGK